MSGPEGPTSTGPTAPLIPSEGPSPASQKSGKHKGVSVEQVESKNNLPKGSSKKKFKRFKDFKSISLLPSAKRRLARPKPEITIQSAAPLPTPAPTSSPTTPTPLPEKKKPEASEEDHQAILESRKVDKDATDIQIENGRKQKGWKKLEKIANPTHKPKISDKGFARLTNELRTRDISNNRELKLVVMFAADKFEKGQLSSGQMEEYMGIVTGKYVMARAKEQANATALTLAPTGSERTGFAGDKPLKASESVQLAELIVTTSHRINSTDAEDKDSGVVHNYKRDFPVDLYGWNGIDFEEMSQSVDRVLLLQFPGKLQEAMLRESGSSSLVPEPSAEYTQMLVEGVERSLDEYTDSLLRTAESRVSNPIYKDASVKESEEKIKLKVATRRDAVIATLEERLKPVTLDKAKLLSTDNMVARKVDHWVKTKEVHDSEETSQVSPVTEQKKEASESAVHRGSMLSDISEELARKVAKSVKRGKKDEAAQAAVDLLKQPPEIAPKPKRPPVSPELKTDSTVTTSRAHAEGEVDGSHQAKASETIKQFEKMSQGKKKPE